MVWIALELSNPKIGLTTGFPFPVKKLTAFKGDEAANAVYTGQNRCRATRNRHFLSIKMVE